MASIYKVKRNQNVFDVAVQLYGSVEGLFDLLMTNDISITDKLSEGQELEYHESFIRNKNVLEALDENETIVAHGNNDILPIPTLDNTKYVLGIAAQKDYSGAITDYISISGNGDAYIDWGDGKVEKMHLTKTPVKITHNYAYIGVYKCKIFACTGNIYSLQCDANTDRYRIAVGNAFILGSSKLGSTDIII